MRIDKKKGRKNIYDHYPKSSTILKLLKLEENLSKTHHNQITYSQC